VSPALSVILWFQTIYFFLHCSLSPVCYATYISHQQKSMLSRNRHLTFVNYRFKIHPETKYNQWNLSWFYSFSLLRLNNGNFVRAGAIYSSLFISLL
jgi:hypothetical protein